MNTGKLFATSGLRDHRPRFETAMRHLSLALPLVLGQVPAAQAQVSVGIGLEMPGVNIGINLPTFPELQRVPGYPVYYAPQAPGNYFYYDALYWVFQADEWYASSWYNGPWQRVMPMYVPAYVLRVPVYYYRQPPPYFRHWRADAPPRWDQHWGRDWQHSRPGWDRWDRHAAHRQRRCPRTSAATRRAATRKTRLGNRRSAPRISTTGPMSPCRDKATRRPIVCRRMRKAGRYSTRRYGLRRRRRQERFRLHSLVKDRRPSNPCRSKIDPSSRTDRQHLVSRQCRKTTGLRNVLNRPTQDRTRRGPTKCPIVRRAMSKSDRRGRPSAARIAQAPSAQPSSQSRPRPNEEQANRRQDKLG